MIIKSLYVSAYVNNSLRSPSGVPKRHVPSLVASFLNLEIRLQMNSIILKLQVFISFITQNIAYIFAL